MPARYDVKATLDILEAEAQKILQEIYALKQFDEKLLSDYMKTESWEDDLTEIKRRAAKIQNIVQLIR